MAKTTEAPVQGANPTPLPETMLGVRKLVWVENLGADAIWVSASQATLIVGVGHKIEAGARAEFPSGAQLWAVSTSSQGGGVGDTTIVTEFE